LRVFNQAAEEQIVSILKEGEPGVSVFRHNLKTPTRETLTATDKIP
jgi:hypothetical protein